MCLGVPMQVVAVGEGEVVAEIDGVRKEASLMLLDEEVRVGDFVIVHAGFAISKLDEEDAQETLRLMREVFRPEDMA
ncbi:HypC/HybG/HupF family hydrogenase formation chaperone [Geobacter sulfurreducens]|jgi:hydrogenase expression/formation protein HypC|uniref:Hydrogenase assembly chaperone HypC/HupF n=3 Tax=Geobacter TaxID=28231 RepID=Q74GD9_GEOSL|nr:MULTISPECIES: HypC/HybG/HupF family hydrogenase formation chaperone [Geobacter]AAR33640.1 hydrogenase assembly chaperone HypC/HupF [Geobacter sulfurreducens PCA]ADI83139.1 hydrogenase assembly chaperone HypC/HupF [Geobacter sulfurreducens KN400]AJY70032.1 hydrogenase assembly protein HupF [Geobacter sulfurreducens]ANA39254.1 hydrogenase assembly protein HupF [Geobacter anodireducens]KIE43986.1 hydrogenase assembly protein HupF [Geobacter soli]